jgi:hypothetical protein
VYDVFKRCAVAGVVMHRVLSGAQTKYIDCVKLDVNDIDTEGQKILRLYTDA